MTIANKSLRFVATISAATALVFSTTGGFPLLAGAATDNNPGFPPSGSCGLDIALVIDTSTSIDGDGLDGPGAAGELGQIQTAFDGFVGALSSTPTIYSISRFDTTASIVLGFGGDQSTVVSTINSVDGSGSTNWQGGLLQAQSSFSSGARPDHFNLVIFASDGNPNYDNSGSVSEATALASAVTVADAIKTGGTRIITVGVGADVNTGNLQAISSPDATFTSDFSTLGTTLAGIASDLCGGTINVTKVIDADSGFSAGGFEFTISNGSDSEVVETDSDTGSATKDVSGSAGPWSVVETVDTDNYTLTEASCTKNGDPVGSPVGNGVGNITLTDPEHDVVSCTFTNTPKFGLLEVTKVLVKDNGTTNAEDVPANFTLLVSGGTPSSFQDSGSGTLVKVMDGVAYDVSENNDVNPTGYFSVPEGQCSGTMVAGEFRACTITNNDLPPNTADISVSKSVSDSTPDNGQQITYTLTAENLGIQNATNVIVSDELPSGVSFVSATGDGSYDPDTDTWTVGPLANGATATIDIVVTVTASAGASVINDASLVSIGEGDDPTDANDSNDSDNATITVNTPASPETDICANIEGVQTTVPEGFVQQNEYCVNPNSGGPGNTGGPNGGGNGSPFFGGGGGGGGPITQGQVLGASCGLFLNDYLRATLQNNSDEVKKLQEFLNEKIGANLPVSGVFGPMTEAAVRKFQSSENSDVLKPWVDAGLLKPGETTGYVYKTTKRWINLMKCPSLNIPLPPLP